MKSLRAQTLFSSADYMQLGVHSVEAFGQSEALTTRLKHIISDYSDGPGILMELLQNADDAGATEVAFLLDEESYGTSSILGAPPLLFTCNLRAQPSLWPTALRFSMPHVLVIGVVVSRTIL